ncbi:protein henna isoform X1 [Hydra vulgaris]|uniref:protein henna isoform X1 n=1 Tax=Hydra vulgaris TaxID=6087 RepID=UPI001F5F57A2|nr:protein henna [Hydra vulgaris]
MIMNNKKKVGTTLTDHIEHNNKKNEYICTIRDERKIEASSCLDTSTEIHWFPKNEAELDQHPSHVLNYGLELDGNHPSFTDPVYRQRRTELASIAKNYQYGQVIPRITYTSQEIETWNSLFKVLTEKYPIYASKEVNELFPLLVKNCGYRVGNIPQLEVVSNFLKERTGFTIRPVAGLLSSRDFLAGLALKVFHATQYIRHHSDPLFTPEPDTVHELLGHVPLLADPDFAELSQEIGLASLGASDEIILKLATLYMFTVEVGLCLQNNEVKAYGAALLSSIGELQYCFSEKSIKVPFDLEEIFATKYSLTEFQPKYFIAESFSDATNKVRKWAKGLPNANVIKYNPITRSIEAIIEVSQMNSQKCMRFD